jgi:hypothetical protein
LDSNYSLLQLSEQSECKYTIVNFYSSTKNNNNDKEQSFYSIYANENNQPVGQASKQHTGR